MDIFAVPPKNRYRHYVFVSAFWQSWEGPLILSVPSPSIFAYYTSAFGDNFKWFGHLLLETTMTELTIVSFFLFILAAKHGAADFFLPARLRALVELDRTGVNERVLAPLPCMMRASFLKCGLSGTAGSCAVGPVAAILAFVRAGKTDGAASDCLGWFRYEIADANFIFLPERKPEILDRGLREDAVPWVLHAEATPRYVDESRAAGMSQEFAGWCGRATRRMQLTWIFHFWRDVAPLT